MHANLHHLHHPDPPIFSARLARDEDQLSLADEREELRVFLAEYEDWLDGRRDLPPDPLP